MASDGSFLLILTLWVTAAIGNETWGHTFTVFGITLRYIDVYFYVFAPW